MNPNTATEYRNLPLDVLTESTTNPRHIFEDAALKELADSIRTQGILSPLLVRPLTEQSFEIVAGARRYRAAQMAEAATVPVRIVNLTDAEALEAQLIENLQRRDVHPMEEAQGFRALLALEEPKYSIEQIAAKVGKTPAYCASRVRLTELVPRRWSRPSTARRSASAMRSCWRSCSRHNRNRHSPIASARSGAEPEPRRSASCSPSGNLQQWIEHNILLTLETGDVQQTRCATRPRCRKLRRLPQTHRTQQAALRRCEPGNSDACTDPTAMPRSWTRTFRRQIAAKPELGADQHGLRPAAGRQQDRYPQQVRRDQAGQARHPGESEVAGVQNVQVHHRGNRL